MTASRLFDIMQTLSIYELSVDISLRKVPIVWGNPIEQAD
jgi:hypothetical protein